MAANLKKLHFKMESIMSLRDLLQPGDYMGKVDLKDAYLTGRKFQFKSLPLQPRQISRSC